MSSPQQQPSPALPVPPAFPRRTSSRSARLHLPQRQGEPPIPPRLVGSPLLNNLISSSSKHQQPQQLARSSDRVQQEVWIDGDEFGTYTRSGTAQVPDIARANTRYTTPPPPQMQGAKFSVTPYGRCALEAHGLTVEFTTLLCSSRGVPA